jgi:superfamily II DNA/RNA helicase
MSTQSFADLGVSTAVADALAGRGITNPFAVQSLVIGDVLAGRDVLAKSPTGSGKTLAFAIPIVQRVEATDRRPAALILAPTRELCSQIVEEMSEVAHARALRAVAVYGGVALHKQGRNAARAHIVVATPGRLEDQLARGAFDLDAVRILVLDEADRMLDMGFKPAVDRIVRQCPSERQTLFFSATLDGDAGRIAGAYTRNAVRREHAPAIEHKPSIDHRFLHVAREQRVDALVRELRLERDRALVFVRTKRGADRLVKRLGHQGVKALAMHGDKSQNQRERALARFESGDPDALVATEVAARGIDVAGISHVINFDPPGDREAYVHRVGRTGRAGRTGVAITFVDPDEVREIAKIADELGVEHRLDPKRSAARPVRPQGANRPHGAGGPRPASRPAPPAGGRPNRRRRRGSGGGFYSERKRAA